MLSAKSFTLSIIYTECYKQTLYAECNFAKRCYAECHYAQWRGANDIA